MCYFINKTQKCTKLFIDTKKEYVIYRQYEKKFVDVFILLGFVFGWGLISDAGKEKTKDSYKLVFVMSLIYLMELNLIQQYGVAVNDIIVNGIVGSAILKMLYIKKEEN